MRTGNRQWIWNGMCIICALISVAALNYFFLYSTGNILNLLFLFVITFLYKRYGLPTIKTRKGICACIGGLLLSVICSLGRVGRTNESLLDALSRYKESLIKDEYAAIVTLTGYEPILEKIAWLILLIGLWLVCWFLLEQFLGYVGETSHNAGDCTKHNVKRKYFWIIAGIFIACWLPYFLINYPGVLTFDSIYQISQIEGVNPLNNKHPVIHTGLIAVCYKAADFFGYSSNAGVAWYSGVQMCILALIYAYAIVVLYQHGLKKKYCIYIVIYFALLPLNAVSAITMWKDILFAGFVLWFSTLLFKIGVGGENSKKYWLLLSISGFLVIMFRLNGFVAYILCLPFILCILKKRWSKRMFVSLFCPIILSLIITGPVYRCLNVEKTNIVDALSIPLQHIARVVVDCEKDLKESQIEKIEQLAPLDDIKQTYNCRFADPMKVLMWGRKSDQIIEDNKWAFFQLWFELGLEHPKEYFLAEIDATLGYWYSEVQYSAMTVGGYPNDYGITWIFDKQPELRNKLIKWCNVYRKIPVLGCFYNMGTVFMLILLVSLFHIYRKQYVGLLVSVPAFMVWCTVMVAVPLHSEMRYIYSSMISIPLIIGNCILSLQYGNDSKFIQKSILVEKRY